MEHTTATNEQLSQRFNELHEQLEAPYLSPARREQVVAELGRIGFEMTERSYDAIQQADSLTS